MNQATLSYNHLKWNPIPENLGTVGEEFEGLIRLGGRDTEQDIKQDKFSLRNDLSYFPGTHSLKGGFVLNFASYEVSKQFEGNPRFFYRSDISSTIPYRARYGSGDPNLDADNTQVGLYIQDDWTPDAAAHVEPRPAVGLRDRHDQQRLRDPGARPVDARRYRGRGPVLHGRKRSRSLLQGVPAPRRDRV